MPINTNSQTVPTFVPQPIQPGQPMGNAPPMSQNGFPGFTTEQERILENEKITKQAFEMAAGPPSKDIRSRLSSRASGRSEEINTAPIQNLSEADTKMKAIFTENFEKNITKIYCSTNFSCFFIVFHETLTVN